MPFTLAMAVRHPEWIVPQILSRLRHFQVSTVVVDGELFHQYLGERYPDYLNHGNASAFIVPKALEYCKGQGIDIGASTWPLPGATPVENEPHQNAYELDSIADGSLDFVFSSHCLEHLDRWRDALALWIRKLKPQGILFLYMPHESMKMWNPAGPWVGYTHRWKPRHEILVPFLREHGMEIVEFNPSRDAWWSFHIVARRRAV